MLEKIPTNHGIYQADEGLLDLIFRFIFSIPQCFLESWSTNKYFLNFVEQVKNLKLALGIWSPFFKNDQNKEAILNKIKNLGTPRISVPTEKNSNLISSQKTEVNIFTLYVTRLQSKLQKPDNQNDKNKYEMFLKGFNREEQPMNMSRELEASHLGGKLIRYITEEKSQKDNEEIDKKSIYLFNRLTNFASLENLNAQVVDMELSDKINDFNDLSREINNFIKEPLN